MTLFRNTEYPSTFKDTGEHDYAYSFMPHSGGLYSGNVAKEAYLFNSPLVVVDGKAERKPFLSLSDDSLIVDCVKPAEDGNGIIVRMYEPYGTSGATTVKLTKNATITEVSPIEETIGESITAKEFDVDFTPFEIKTYRITY
jgi:alpha-mannosidase